MSLSVIGGGAAAATAVVAQPNFVNSLANFNNLNSFFGLNNYYCEFCGSGYYCYNGQCYARVDNGNPNNAGDLICVGGVCYSSGTGFSSGYATSSGISFDKSIYRFTTTSCTASTSVGTVSANSASNYSVNTNQFAVSSSGAISLPSALAAGTYAFTVFGSSSSSGSTNSASVTGKRLHTIRRVIFGNDDLITLADLVQELIAHTSW